MTASPTRRTVLKRATASGVLASLIAAGIVRPGQALAEWNKAAFEARNAASALAGIGAASEADNKEIKLRVADIVENGAAVPVDVVSNIMNTSSIAILVDNNPFPLAAYFELTNGALAEVSAQIKITQNSKVKAVVKAGGKFYSAQKEVKLTIGDCGA